MPLATDRLFEIVAELARRPGHEAVRTAVSELLTQGLGAELHAIRHEHRVVEARGRIDALLGRTLLEFKANLSRERDDAREQLARYLPERERNTGQRFVGIATDGLDWEVYEFRGGELVLLRTFKADPRAPERLLTALDGVVATREEIPPDALNIRAELGHESVAFLRAKAEFGRAWSEVADHPTASLQRQLWSQLLTLAYGRRVEDDDLWLQHTFLVVVAKCIAARVMEVEAEEPEAILTGRVFAASGILGAVESDFFNWILLAPSGPDLVRRLARHVGRFRLREVTIDLMKVLYESLIDRDHRHGLGEYYTPDWLAAKVVRRAISEPLQENVLDPACGSGTFLFHAVRRVIAEAEDAGLEPENWAVHTTQHVAGMDIHPIAVIIARVTYLLALAPALSSREGNISIPVYLSDALQLSVQTYMERRELVITVPAAPGEPETVVCNGGMTGGGATNGAAVLVFPEELARYGPVFDGVIEDFRAASEAGESPDQLRTRAELTVGRFHKRDVTRKEADALDDVAKTFATFEALRKAGRDTIWGYVARNLSRPFTFSARRWAHVLIGNPPWLAFRHMTAELQTRFRELAKGERIYVGGRMATQNDLCALFAVRAAGLYLVPSGRIALVLPRAVLGGGQFEAFRKGSYLSSRIQWEEVWDLDGVEPLFPVPACVAFGKRRATGKAMPSPSIAYAGRLPLRDASEALADEKLDEIKGGSSQPARSSKAKRSAYESLFHQGATLVPRALILVERKSAGRLGASRSKPLVQSRRSTQEKAPWKDIAPVEAAVEAEFLKPVYLGESILPFRVFRSFEGVVPLTTQGDVIDVGTATDRGISGLASWLRAANRIWEENRKSDLSLIGRWNYYSLLESQHPIAPLRVVYAKAGINPAACLLRDPEGVIDHMLYWLAVETEAEGHYLTAILNAEETRRRVAHLQSRGLFGARHFDKVMLTLPIPRFSASDPAHAALARLGKAAETLASTVEIPEGAPFTRARKLVREALTQDGTSKNIDAAVNALLAPA